MPHYFDRKTEDASCCRKICAASADRRTKTEPRHSQSGTLDRSNTDENFLENVITGDETWVYGYDVETKVQSSQCVGKSSSRPKEACQCRSNMKVMLIVFFLIGRVLFIMSLFHVVRQSIKSFTWRSWSVWGKQCEGRDLRRGQTRPGCCTMTMHLPKRRFLSVNFWRSKRRLACPSPLLSRFGPCGLFLFPKLKSIIKDRRFQTVEEIKDNSLQDLRTIPQNTFQDAFQNWKKRWERCINSRGECFEGDKSE